MFHSQVLRDTLRETGPDQPAKLSEAFADATAASVEPWYRATLAFDRHRLAEMAAAAEGVAYAPEDPGYEITKALEVASAKDPDALRAFLSIVGVLELPDVALAGPGLLDKVIELGADWRDQPAFGPSRDELVALATA
jgi:hypothetical protein